MMMSTRRKQHLPALSSLATLAAVCSFAGLAHAQEPALPAGTAGTQGPASSGATELEGQGTMATAEAVEEPAEDVESLDATEFNLGAGGILNTGNSRSLAMTATSNLRIRRSRHQFSANLAGNFGRAATEKGGPWLDTTRNVQGRVRYDVFFAERWSAFLMATMRNDVFQGLDYRLNVDPGVAFYAIPKKNHRLWFEAGYDLQYDIRTNGSILVHDDDGNIVLDGDGNTARALEKTDVNHAARLFAGYVNNINERVNFTTGFEYLQSFLAGERFRMNFDLGLSTQIKERLSLATTFTLRYDNAPLPEVEKLDTITSLQLTYRFF
jgi:putative salt-induced outer membrane protein